DGRAQLLATQLVADYSQLRALPWEATSAGDVRPRLRVALRTTHRELAALALLDGSRPSAHTARLRRLQGRLIAGVLRIQALIEARRLTAARELAANMIAPNHELLAMALTTASSHERDADARVARAKELWLSALLLALTGSIALALLHGLTRRRDLE